MNTAGSPSVLERLRGWLQREQVVFREIRHAPTRTSEDSARARGEPLRIGGKALLVKLDDGFHLFVLSADRRLDAAAVKRELGSRNLRFATASELQDLTSLVPGSVPPFGHPLLPFPLHLDVSVLQNDRIAFNAGSLTVSLVLPTPDYLRLAQPHVFAFAVPP